MNLGEWRELNGLRYSELRSKPKRSENRSPHRGRRTDLLPFAHMMAPVQKGGMVRPQSPDAGPKFSVSFDPLADSWLFALPSHGRHCDILRY